MLRSLRSLQLLGSRQPAVSGSRRQSTPLPPRTAKSVPTAPPIGVRVTQPGVAPDYTRTGGPALLPWSRGSPAAVAERRLERAETGSRWLARCRAPLADRFRRARPDLGGGFRAGELILLAGPQGLGKTTWALQVGRNIARRRAPGRLLLLRARPGGPDRAAGRPRGRARSAGWTHRTCARIRTDVRGPSTPTAARPGASGSATWKGGARGHRPRLGRTPTDYVLHRSSGTQRPASR